MRTTVTLEPDTEALVRRHMRARGVSFKQAINEAIRAGLAEGGQQEPFRTPTSDMGEPFVPVVKALQLAGQLEDEELIRKMASGK